MFTQILNTMQLYQPRIIRSKFSYSWQSIQTQMIVWMCLIRVTMTVIAHRLRALSAAGYSTSSSMCCPTKASQIGIANKLIHLLSWVILLINIRKLLNQPRHLNHDCTDKGQAIIGIMEVSTTKRMMTLLNWAHLQPTISLSGSLNLYLLMSSSLI